MTPDPDYNPDREEPAFEPRYDGMWRPDPTPEEDAIDAMWVPDDF
jgi:hypothetical protein